MEIAKLVDAVEPHPRLIERAHIRGWSLLHETGTTEKPRKQHYRQGAAPEAGMGLTAHITPIVAAMDNGSGTVCREGHCPIGQRGRFRLCRRVRCRRPRRCALYCEEYVRAENGR